MIKMKQISRFSTYLSNWMYFLAVMAGIYVFIGVCNWELSLAHWNVFSRFIFASAGLCLFFYTLSENRDVAARYRQARLNKEKEEDKKVKL
jgi:hypothetical protein